MDDKELSALKALAEVATPGPWDTNTAGATKDGVFTYDEVYVYSPENRKVAIAADIADPKTGEPSVANSQFIARANPAAILSLISRLEQAEAASTERANNAIDQTILSMRENITASPALGGENFSLIKIAHHLISDEPKDCDEQFLAGRAYGITEMLSEIEKLSVVATSTKDAVQSDAWQMSFDERGDLLLNRGGSQLRFVPATSTKPADDDLPITMSIYGSLEACEAERVRRASTSGAAGTGDVKSMPPLPYTNYNGYSDGSEPLYTAEHMHDYAESYAAAQLDWLREENADLRAQIARQQVSVGDTLDEDSRFINLMTAWANECPGEDALAAFDAIVAYITAWKDAQLARERQGNSMPVGWMVGLELFRTKAEAERNVRNPDLKPRPLIFGDSPQAQGEPVAWMWEFCMPSGWVTLAGKEKPEPSEYVRNLQPLYTTPAPQADEVRDSERLDFLEELAARNEESMPNVRAFGKTFMGETLRDAIDIAMFTTAADNQTKGE